MAPMPPISTALIDNDKIRVAQINTRRSKLATLETINYCKEQYIDIILMQEPYTSKNKISYIPLNVHTQFRTAIRPWQQ